MKVKNLLTVVCLSLMASTAFASTKQDSIRQSSKPSLVKKVGSGIKNTASKVGNGIKKAGTTIKQKVTPVPASLISACNQAASTKVEAFQAEFPELASAIDTAAMTKSASSKCSLDAKKQLNGQQVSGTSLFDIEDTTFSDAIEGVQSSKNTNKSCTQQNNLITKLKSENAALKRQISQISNDSEDDEEEVTEIPQKRAVKKTISRTASRNLKSVPVEEEQPAAAPVVETPAPAPVNNFRW